MAVAIGIDSHKSTLAVAAVDDLGRQLAVRQFPNHASGHRALLAWVKATGETRAIGIEGSGSYGACLARLLMSDGEVVSEIPTSLAHRERRRGASKGKCDTADAVAIARVVARGEGLSSARRGELWEEMKLLSDHRDQLKRLRTQTTNRIHKDLVVLCPGYERRVPSLTAKKHLRAVQALIDRDSSRRAELMRWRIGEVARIDSELTRVTREIKAKVKESGTTLAELVGVGAVTAAKILGEVGSIERIRSKSAFAMLNGSAPLPASSGSSSRRHRFNPGGNRQLNFALHTVALTRLRMHRETRAYIERKSAEGKSHKEVMRCLKRQLSNVIYRQLLSDVKGVAIAA